MKSQKLHVVKYVFFMVFFFLLLTGFLGQKANTVSFSGIIDRIDNDSKFILVSGTKVLLSPNSRLVDEKGNPLRIDALRPKSFVSIEGVRNREGLLATRIVLKTLKRSP